MTMGSKIYWPIKQINLAPLWKENSQPSVVASVEYLRKYMRQQVETIFNQISAKLPKSIHAVTAQRFELKIVLLSLPLLVTIYRPQLGLI